VPNYFRNTLQRFACLLVLTVLLGSTSCGRSGLDRSTPVTLDDAVQQIDAVQAPANVSPKTLNALKAALESALKSTSGLTISLHPPQGPGSTVTDLTYALQPDGSPGLQWSYANPGDYNFDGQVNKADLVQLALFFGHGKDSPDWDKAQYVDGDHNGLITLADITPMAVNYYGTVVAWKLEGASSPDGPWSEIQEVPFSAGTAPDFLTPPQFNLGQPDGYAYFRICGVDPDGNETPNSNVSQPVTLKSNVHFLDSIEDGQFEAHGSKLTVPDTGSVKAGDIFVDSYDAVIVRADKVVAGGGTITAYCSPATLADVIRSGVVDISLQGIVPDSSIDTSDFSFPIGAQQLGEDGSLAVRAVSGGVHFFPAGHLRACFDPLRGLTSTEADLDGSHMNMTLGCEATGSAYSGQFPATAGAAANFERALGTAQFHGLADIGSGLHIPVVVTYTAVLGLQGSGWLDGSFSQSFLLDTEDWHLHSHYDSATRVASQVGSYDVGFPNISPDLPALSGNMDFTLTPYVRVSASLEAFPGNTYSTGLPDQADVSATATLFAQEHVANTHTPAEGYNFEDQGWSESEILMRFDRLGLPAQGFTLDLADQAHFLFRNGFIPAPVAPVTYTVSGTVTDQSLPLQGAEVTVSDSSTSAVLGHDTTDATGAYSISNLPEGAVVTISATLGSYTFDPPNYIVTLDGDKVVDFNTPPPTTYKITGSVFDYINPLQGVTITVTDSSTLATLGSAITNDDGGYEIDGIPAGASVMVTPEFFSYIFDPPQIMLTMDADKVADFNTAP